MVSLKDLPYEFVFLTKEPNPSFCPQSLLPVHSPSPSSLHFQCTPRPTGIKCSAKPAVPSPYIKRGQIHLVRGVRSKIKRSLRYFQHHQHARHLHRKEDWRAEYSRLAPPTGQITYAPKVETRASLLSGIKKNAEKSSNRAIARYMRSQENKQKKSSSKCIH